MSEIIREAGQVFSAKPTIEGAGVHLKRAFGYHQVPAFDPFLLLDDFHSDEPEKYLKGFPWHPHRGIETITYVLHGEVEHGDSMGNKGVIGPGDVQWMTAGSGIIHQEMPRGDSRDRLWGFQLWANLPASHKMMPPRYREINSTEIPEAVLDGDVSARVICGQAGGVVGPVRDVVIDPLFIDIRVPSEREFSLPTPAGHTVFAYVIEGGIAFGDLADKENSAETLVLFGDGDRLVARTGRQPARFLLVAGKPLNEPVAWGGPIVMNTREELQEAFEQYEAGTFIK